MLKKDKSEPKYTHNIYTCYDKVSKKYRGIFYHANDEEMIRNSLPTILYDLPLRDIEIYRIGKFNEDNGEFVYLKKVQIPTDCYTFPHSRLSCTGDDLSLSELDNGIKENKNQIISKLSENNSENKSESEVKEA